MKHNLVRTIILSGGLLSAAPAFAQSWAEAPRPPEGAAFNQTIPALDAQGNYRTPNRDLSPAQASWHMRAALNVAALACRGAIEAEMVAGYNQLLSLHQTAFASADAGVKALYRARHGSAWKAEHDRDMTRVYNFFAQPPAHTEFCSAAHEVLAEALSVQPQALEMFAATALPRLEAPFTGFYRAYDTYRSALAAWRGEPQRSMVTVTMAAASAPTTRLPTFP